MKKIILASTSPRRRSILELTNLSFEVKHFIIDEDKEINNSLTPNEIVKNISEKKALNSLEFIQEPSIIITADTVVCTQNNEILGKPNNAEEAFATINKLQNTMHYVYTAVTVIDKGFDSSYTIDTIVDETKVFMRPLCNEEINAYIKTGEPFDKAGAYGIQGKGILLIEKIEGDYLNVVGLPLLKLCKLLKSIGINNIYY